ncbi:hypothetical protein AC249_AIPGENE9325 [Exaiptasia diaphana]|nr:hypothetical protein AC249_AIPGENE9325 [Exaiptasia diaphana]
MFDIYRNSLLKQHYYTCVPKGDFSTDPESKFTFFQQIQLGFIDKNENSTQDMVEILRMVSNKDVLDGYILLAISKHFGMDSLDSPPTTNGPPEESHGIASTVKLYQESGFRMSGKRTVLYCDRNRTVTKFQCPIGSPKL